MDKDVYFMQIALAEAKVAFDEGEVPVGAVVVEGDRVVAKAHNKKEALCDPTAHAEMLAIREAARTLGDWRLRDSALYVTLEPCVMCVGAIVEARIRRVVFGAFDDERGAADLLRNEGWMPYKIEVRGGVLEEECRKILTFFFNRVRSGGRDGRVD